MLYFVGLGLGNEKDVTVYGLEIIKQCEYVYLEAYTSLLTVGKDKLEKFYERPIALADRELVESGADEILDKAVESNVAFLVVGDPFGATTHSDLQLRASKRGIPTKVIHNASILTAVGCCGLQLYSFGEVVSIPLWTDSWQPESYFDKIVENRKRKSHTLCLLDIKVKEPTLESLCSKKKVYAPPKFMTVSEAAEQLLKIIERRENAGEKDLGLTRRSLVVGLARIGCEDQKIEVGSLLELSKRDLGPPLHSLVIPSENLHCLEKDSLSEYALNNNEFEEITKGT